MTFVRTVLFERRNVTPSARSIPIARISKADSLREAASVGSRGAGGYRTRQRCWNFAPARSILRCPQC
jgi:hypothetical protein